MEKIKLFCIPYAGGSAVIFNQWKIHLDRSIEVIPLELAGRGTRMGEPCKTSILDSVDDLFQTIEPDISRSSYALLGHSMGSIIAFELAHKIQAKKLNQPLHFFVSGRRAPQYRLQKEIIYHLPLEEFKRELMELGGTSAELFEHEELFELFLPILRADFQQIGQYEFQEKSNKLACNMTILSGRSDRITEEEAAAWKKHSLGKSELHFFDGGHFFINEQLKAVVSLINQTLSAYARISPV